MRHRRWLIMVIASSFMAMAVSAEQARPVSKGIGYPSVAAALADLRGRSDVKISDQGGWTIVNDRAAGAVWSFTPPGHPAHPAAVKRVITQRDGVIYVEMGALCQAGKAACDKLIAEFQELNDKIRESMKKESGASQRQWAPSAQQKSRAEETLFRFLKATDQAKYRDAYRLFTAGMKSLMTFEKFVSHEKAFRTVAGDDPRRSDIRATWSKDPPRAAAPGIYAAFDITCRLRNIDLCTEVVILHEQKNGKFLVMRHERNYVDKDNEAKLRDQQGQRKNP